MQRFPPNAARKGGAAAGRVHARAAEDFAGPLLALVASLRAQGLSLRAIGRELEQRGIGTRTGGVYDVSGGPMRKCRWGPSQVRRLVKRLEAKRSAQERAKAPATLLDHGGGRKGEEANQVDVVNLNGGNHADYLTARIAREETAENRHLEISDEPTPPPSTGPT